MKRIVLFVTLLSILCSCSSRQDTGLLFTYFKGNGEDGLHLAHSEDGLYWSALNNDISFLEPRVGEDKLMRDPCIVQGPDGTFHMVWTVSWGERGIGYASSKDLIHWSEQQYIPVMEHEPDAKNCWAPELFYDAEEDQYLIFWATTIPGRFPETDNQSNQGPPAPGNNHRMYYTTTSDFQEFAPTQIFYDKNFNVIDATIEEHDGRYIMFLKDETNRPFTPQKNIRIAYADDPEGPWSKASQPITGDYWAEGPTAIRIGDLWHVYFDKYRQGAWGVVASEDLGEWSDLSEGLRMPEGARHGTVFRAPQHIIDALMNLSSLQ
ncbi:MAG: glycosyl hydrolase [Candidatus Marinimicrobia bacterium]|nr:glycosyl hydrolase [Candidatus Neomarinimicrobiota bacterium]